MKFVMTTFFLTLFSLSSLAEDKIDKGLAIEYLKLSKTEEMINASIQEYDSQLFKNAAPEDRAKFKKLMVDTMGWNAIKDQLAELVINLYTKEEIDAWIKFMKSPAGASATAKNEEYSKRFSTILSKNMDNVLKQCCEQQK